MTMVTEWSRQPGFAAHAPSSEARHAATSGLARLFDLVRFWRGGVEWRRSYGPIDDHLLRDIGLTRADIGLIARHPRRER